MTSSSNLEIQSQFESTGFRRGQRGSVLVELAVNLAIVSVLTASTVPSVTTMLATYRIQGAARSVAGELNLAKLRGAALFTKTKVVFDTTASSFQLQVYDKTSAAYIQEGGTESLPEGIKFGYGSITTPAGSQTSIALSTAVIFNSRGIPVDGTGAPTGLYAIYLNDGKGTYVAVTENVNGSVEIWRYSGSSWVKTG